MYIKGCFETLPSYEFCHVMSDETLCRFIQTVCRFQAAADAGDETPKGGDPYDGYGGLGYDENDNDDDDVAEELSAAHANAAAAAAAASAARNQVPYFIISLVVNLAYALQSGWIAR